MTTERKIEIAKLILKINSDEFICLITLDMLCNDMMSKQEREEIKVDMFGFLRSNPNLNDNFQIKKGSEWFKESRDESNNYSTAKLNSIRINFLNKYIEHLKNQEPPMMGM